MLVLQTLKNVSLASIFQLVQGFHLGNLGARNLALHCQISLCTGRGNFNSSSDEQVSKITSWESEERSPIAVDAGTKAT